MKQQAQKTYAKALGASLIASSMLVVTASARAQTTESAELRQVKQELLELKNSYELRLKDIDARLKQAEMSSASAQVPAAVQPSAKSGGGFNPDTTLILSSRFAKLDKDSSKYRIKGFRTAEGIDPGARGFGLGESELGLSANVDHLFYGALNLALDSDNSVGVEEAFIQTTALPYGLTVKAGRFLSALGYQNEQHAHTWDFADAALPMQAFLGGQYKQEGLQARWLLPTSQYLELVAEAGRGAEFPGSAQDKNKPNAISLGLRTGGDLGRSNSWKAGISVLKTKPSGRVSQDFDLAGNDVSNEFSGNSNLYIIDGVWKWAPNGNARNQNFKLQGEYFSRKENGMLTYDSTNSAQTDTYSAKQSGWYLQGVYQFMPAWRVGLRTEQLNSGNPNYAGNAANFASAGLKPQRNSMMLDWSPSEFSRVRLQMTQDKSALGAATKQWYLQYQMSLGAHGAHNY